jgi:hypothetical protein
VPAPINIMTTTDGGQLGGANNADEAGSIGLSRSGEQQAERG